MVCCVDRTTGSMVAEVKMDALTTYNYALEVAAAFLIFLIGYLALFLAIAFCLLAAEAVHQSARFARKSLLRPLPDQTRPVPANHRTSAFFGRTHRLAGGSVGSLRHR